MNVNDKINGFTVTRIRELGEVSGRLTELRHDKTGSEVCHMDNGENNKLFSISFKTIPEDHTGVFHILEHSVLCGSKKYPVKEPFVELIKSSMNTFLNAMTFPDKTMYPVSSRNEKDFLNLTRVYLDAVFAPSILENPNIFYQEGHHIEVDAEGNPSYKGVVFNEMKGVISSVDEAVEMAMNDMLYPDSCYKYVSGGHPEHIPDLTYEQFIDTYKRFYHPSNAKVWLDGDVPLSEVLSILDTEYFSKFEAAESLPELKYQGEVPAVKREAFYEIAEDEETEDKTQIVYGRIIGDWQDKEKILALDIINDVLAGSNDAPLKRAILEEGLAKDFSITLYDGIAQPFMYLRYHNTEDCREEAIKANLEKVLTFMAGGGLSRADLEASLNQLEFRVLEASEPQGLNRCINSMNAWLYGGDPAMYITWKDAFASLRAKMDTDYFEDLIREYYLDNSKLSTLILRPSLTFGEEMREKERARLAMEMEKRTDAEKEELRKLCASLEKWQLTPDSPKALATIPTLDISEVSPEPALSHFEETEVDGVKVLLHKAPTGGVCHVVMYFDLSDYTKEELSYISFLPMLFEELPTKNRDAISLQRETKKYLGRLNFNIDIFADRGQTDECTPYFTAVTSFLAQNKDKAMELVREILLETDFTSPEKIKEILCQEEDFLRQNLIMGGHSIAMTRVLSHYSAGQAVKEATCGFERYTALSGTVKDFDGVYDKLFSLFTKFSGQTVCKKRMTLSVTAPDADEFDSISVIGVYPEGEDVVSVKYEKATTPMKEGIKIPAQVSYASVGSNLSFLGADYSGAASIISGLLSYGALWNKVRVQGGAYGAGLLIRSNGNMATYSYRDPSAARTLGIYKELADDLREFCESDEKIDKYIISSIARLEPVRSHLAESNARDAEWFCKIDEDYVRGHRKEMLSATKADLLSYADVLDRMANEGAVCVVGYDGVLAGCEGLEITSM